MLRFSVYNESGPADAWSVEGAFALGPEDLATKASIAFEAGQIVVDRKGDDAVALGLQFDSGRSGELVLQTCLLPSRDRPYHLAVELARHRIKMFIAKSEEWQMFDLAADHPAVLRWEEARRLLTSALTVDDPIGADRRARQALTLGIEATELLALAHAELLLHHRFGARAASSTTLGVRVWPERDSGPLKELVKRDLDLMMLPVRWRSLEVEEGSYDWGPLDRWIEWARGIGKPIVLGPLLDFSKRNIPDWLYVWQHDYETCRDMVYDHLERVVYRYRNVVSMWNLGAGVNVNDNFQFTPEQMIDLVRTASLLVRQGNRRARAMIEVVQPFGEYVGRTNNAVAPMTFVERVVQEGVRLDAVGVRLLLGSGEAGLETRDLMQVSNVLDRFFHLDLPVLVSAAGVPAGQQAGGGNWHGDWSPIQQAKWGSRVFAIAMSKPFVESIFWTDLYDHDGAELDTGGLIDDDGRTRPVLSKLIGMRKRLRKPLGRRDTIASKQIAS